MRKIKKQFLIVTVVMAFGVLAITMTGCGKSSSHSTSSDKQKLSARELITERAKSRHGSNARVQVIGGYAGGSYVVEVYVPIKSGMYAGGADNYTYTAMADEKSQRVTVWKLTSHN